MIIGFAENQGTDLNAVYWSSADAAPINLNSLIDPNDGWTLQQALQINNAGWITGIGLFDPDGPGGQAAYSGDILN